MMFRITKQLTWKGSNFLKHHHSSTCADTHYACLDAFETHRAIDRAADIGSVWNAAVDAGDRGSTEPRARSPQQISLGHHCLRRTELHIQHGQLHGADDRRHEQAHHLRKLRPRSKLTIHITSCFVFRLGVQQVRLGNLHAKDIDTL